MYRCTYVGAQDCIGREMTCGCSARDEIQKPCKKEKESRLGLIEEKSFKKEKDCRQSLVDEKSSKKDKKKHVMKKEKRRDKEPKDSFKEKSLLGQKLKMAKIFGTSSEDESTTRNSKPMEGKR